MRTSVRILKVKHQTIVKICYVEQRTIFIVIKFKLQKGDFAGHCPISIYFSVIENAHFLELIYYTSSWERGSGKCKLFYTASK